MKIVKGLTPMETSFIEWWELDEWDGCNEQQIARDGFTAGWREVCRRSAEAAWKAETHHGAVDAINGVAEAIVWEP